MISESVDNVTETALGIPMCIESGDSSNVTKRRWEYRCLLRNNNVRETALGLPILSESGDNVRETALRIPMCRHSSNDVSEPRLES